MSPMTRPLRHDDPHADADTPGAVHDPVCDHWVLPGKAPARSEAGGATVHFCSLACKRAFDKDPGKFLPRLRR